MQTSFSQISFLKSFGAAAAALVFSVGSALAQAPVHIEKAWARASVAGQKASGGFMKITASEPLRLIGVTTPVSKSAEIHEMAMEDDVMKMRQIQALELPAGQMVELKPGGYHLMFMQLHRPLEEGRDVPVTLEFEDAKGEHYFQDVELPVRRFNTASGHSSHEDKHEHDHDDHDDHEHEPKHEH